MRVSFYLHEDIIVIAAASHKPAASHIIATPAINIIILNVFGMMPVTLLPSRLRHLRHIVTPRYAYATPLSYVRRHDMRGKRKERCDMMMTLRETTTYYCLPMLSAAAAQNTRLCFEPR